VQEGVELAEVDPSGREASHDDTVHIVEMGARDAARTETSVAWPTASLSSRPWSAPACIPSGRGVRLAARDPQNGRFGRGAARVSHLPGEFHVLVPNKRLLTPRAQRAPRWCRCSRGFRRVFPRQHPMLDCRIDRALQAGRSRASGRVRVRGYVSCVLGCPFGRRDQAAGGRRRQRTNLWTSLLRRFRSATHWHRNVR